MKIIDISMPIFSGRRIHSPELYPAVTIERLLTPDMDKSFGRVVSKFAGIVHSGTHVDAPLHMLGEEAKAIGDYPLSKFMGDGVLADVRDKVPAKDIMPEDLEKSVGSVIQEGDILLIRTDMGKDYGDPSKYFEESPYLTSAASQWCVDRKVKLLGVDFFHHKGSADIEWTGSKVLFKNDILTLTYLDNLWEITSKRFTVIAFPIKMEAVESSWARAVVIEGI